MPMRKLPFLLVVTVPIFFTKLFGQDDQTSSKKYLADCKAGVSAHVPTEVLEDTKRCKRWLSSFEIPLIKTDKSQVCAIDGIVQIGNSNKENKNIGRVCVDLLVNKLVSASYNDYILVRIEDWPESFYLENHKATLLALAKKPSTPYQSSFISLLARLNYEPALELIREQLANKKTPTATKFYYHIFLAKTGEQPSIDWLTDFLSRKKINDASVEIVPLILSTKQKPLVGWVVNGLFDVEERCYSSDPDAEKKIHCGYQILEYLAPVIKDFPFRADMNGIDTDNYEQALIDSREWFSKNPNYVIK
jgi:hypothetical protein